jgi:hypothetical protein
MTLGTGEPWALKGTQLRTIIGQAGGTEAFGASRVSCGRRLQAEAGLRRVVERGHDLGEGQAGGEPVGFSRGGDLHFALGDQHSE